MPALAMLLVLPSLFSVLVSPSGYGFAYGTVAALAALSGLGLLFAGRAGRAPRAGD